MNKAVKWMGARSGITFGFGLGGFFDGFFFHAILQWHHMLSNVVPPTDMHGMVVNMVADGWFDGFCWLVLIAGVVLAYKDGKAGVLPSGKAYFGWNLLGAGLSISSRESSIMRSYGFITCAELRPTWCGTLVFC
ncbi:MAG: DUF2243 domain-containing protein [Acidobacteriaceae bacterium]